MEDDRRFMDQKKLILNNLHNVLNILHKIYVSQRLYIHHWKAACNLEIQIERLSLEFYRLSWEVFEAAIINLHGRSLRRVTFSGSRPYKSML